MNEVQALAAPMRGTLLVMAQQALRLLGPTPDLVSQAEGDARVFMHDFVWRDHNKDYRSLAACPLPELRDLLVNILRLDGQGNVVQEALVGTHDDGNPKKAGWLLIHKEHMQLLEVRGSTKPCTPYQNLGTDAILAAGW